VDGAIEGREEGVIEEEKEQPPPNARQQITKLSNKSGSSASRETVTLQFPGEHFSRIT
jgi:hypothetical protein